MNYRSINREEELKNRVAKDYFSKFDSTKIIGNIDFCVTNKNKENLSALVAQPLFWAEAKLKRADINHSIVQLILTIGKARTFDDYPPPVYLGAFNSKKIVFLPYNEIQNIFYLNDFNWNIRPSDHNTKEFKLIFNKINEIINKKNYIFSFETDYEEIAEFIRKNFFEGKNDTTQLQIDKNNFVFVYNRWLREVQPSIAVDWAKAKKQNIIDCDFYLADLLSTNNKTIKEKLFVLLKQDHYLLNRKIGEAGLFSSQESYFKDKQKAHAQFWRKYKRPPKKEYWDYIINRRDLLVPQDIRERKGSFYTPQIWVELSQKYIAKALGEDWQDEYTIWDCAAGTGNLLAGLTNKYNVWASTIDKQDVDVIKDRIQNGANLLESQVFQFDFLNDEFSKLPDNLQKIIKDPEKRKKLIIYINPPYAEAGKGLIRKHGKKGVNLSRVHTIYGDFLRKAKYEIFSQFMARIYNEIKGCKIAEFSKLKILQAPNFCDFREKFLAKLIKMFIVPAYTFDNVKGQFPIGFKVWDTNKKEEFKFIISDIFDKNAEKIGNKKIYVHDQNELITKLIQKKIDTSIKIGHLFSVGNDFQQQRALFIDHYKRPKPLGGRNTTITKNNLINVCVFFAVRKVIPATWINDRDQFLYPKKWETDTEFQNDCLVYTLFNNNIQSEFGVNHWIPFREEEINAKAKFESNFMADFIEGKLNDENNELDEENKEHRKTPLLFSDEAQAVFKAGKNLWEYYHEQSDCKVNASLYDIREYFQGRNENGKMNNKSSNTNYTQLITILRENLKILAKKITPKLYEYEFLKE